MMENIDLIFGCVFSGFVLGYMYKGAMQKMRETDPVYGCELYNEQGCTHVDGMLCNFPKCSMLQDYRTKSKPPVAEGE